MSRDPLRSGFLTCELWGFVGLAVVLVIGFPDDPALAANFVVAYSALCVAYGVMAGGRSVIKAKVAGKSELLEGTVERPKGDGIVVGLE